MIKLPKDCTLTRGDFIVIVVIVTLFNVLHTILTNMVDFSFTIIGG